MLCTIHETGEEVPFNVSIHKNVDISKLSASDKEKVISTVKESGSIAVLKDSKPTYIAEVKLTRYNPILKQLDSVKIKYTTKQAIEAGLYKGINQAGEEVKGKANWNAHPATHLIKMCTMIAGRIIASDALNGIYTSDEISFIQDTKDSAFDEAEVID